MSFLSAISVIGSLAPSPLTWLYPSCRVELDFLILYLDLQYSRGAVGRYEL